MITTILLILALVCFLLGAFGTPSRIGWTDAGSVLCVAAWLAGRV